MITVTGAIFMIIVTGAFFMIIVTGDNLYDHTNR